LRRSAAFLVGAPQNDVLGAQEAYVSTHLSPDELARSHRWHAVECNNLAWRLAEAAVRTPAQDEEMLDAAHASSFHWAIAGTELHRARARMLLAKVHAALGHAEMALAYARQSSAYILSHEPPDWEVAFTHAVLAHAAFAAGDMDLHRSEHRAAQELGNAISDPEDRDVFLRSFAAIPKPTSLGA
jgi:hypothetical protein